MIRFIFCLMGILCSSVSMAQSERPYTDAEMKRWTELSCSLAKCIGKTYKDYSVNAQDCNSFSWAEMDFKDKDNPKPLTVTDSKNQPVGNYPYYNIVFKKSEDSLTAEENRYLLLIKEVVNDGKIDQEKLTAAGIYESKMRACQSVEIFIRANVVADCKKQYYVGTKPENLAIPNTAFSYLYLFPEGKAVLNENGEGEGGTDAGLFYREKALVILGAKPKVDSDPVAGKQNWKQDIITPVDKASECIMQPIKNIWIEINGSEADVREMIKKIDWRYLQSLINK